MPQKTDNNISLRQRLEEFIHTEIRPYLLNHNGDLVIKEVVGIDVGIVFKGSCATCPSAQMTMEEVIEDKLREKFGNEVGRVYLINETSEELLDFAKKILNKTK